MYKHLVFRSLGVYPVLLMLILGTCHCRRIQIQPKPIECTASDAFTDTGEGSSLLQQCLSMDKALYITESGDTLLLSPGTHTITNFSTNILRDVSNVTIMGNPGNPESVIIDCSEGVGLFFFNVSDLAITGVTIEHCGIRGMDRINEIMNVTREVIDILYTPLLDFSTAIYLAHCPNLHLSSVIIRDNRGFGLVGINLVGNVTFHRVHIFQNYPSRCVIDLENYLEIGGSGGGMFIVYQDYLNLQVVRGCRSRQNSSDQENIRDTQFYFTESNITDNYVCRLNLFNVLHNKLPKSIKHPLPLNLSMIGAGGVTFSLAQSSYQVDAHFESCIFRNNSGTYNGAAMHIAQFELSSDSHIFVEETIFEENGKELIRQFGDRGTGQAGAMLVWYYAPNPQDFSNVRLAITLINQQPSSVIVSNSTFNGNVAKIGGAMCVFSFGPEIGLIQDLLVLNGTTFENNRADIGAAIYMTELSYSAFKHGLSVHLHNVDITRNVKKDTSAGSSLQSESGIVDVNYLNISMTGDNYIAHNNNTGLSLHSAIATINGNSLFEFNVGSTGGAIALASESYLVLTGSTNITFFRNRALISGGAIHVNFGYTRFSRYDCFVFFADTNFFCKIFKNCQYERVFAKFINNTAPLGSAIYGSTLTNCPWANGTFEEANFVLGKEQLLRFEPSLTIRPDLRNNNPNIVNTLPISIFTLKDDLSFTMLPGKILQVDLGAFDQLNQSVPLTIFSQLILLEGIFSEKAKALIGATNRYLIDGATNFMSVPVQVFGMQDSTYRLSITSDEAQVDISFNITLKNCSLGFYFNSSSLVCDCLIIKFNNRVTCENDGAVIVPKGSWVGYFPDHGFALQQCHPNFCKNVTRVFLDDPDTQCNNNRSGILCGQCKVGYSRVLGSSTCYKCSNSNLSLIIVFAILGILLVVVIALFNITITDGYINGYIFYGNILSLYLDVFLTIPKLISSSGGRVLIGWINLDFAIEACFYDGMTDIQLTALTLIFPIYLGAILVVITLILKYCHNRHFAKLLNKVNITHIFATLLLLTYSSIVRTCIDILCFTFIDGQPLKWRIDPNQTYFHGLHIFEFFVAVFFCGVLFPLPFFLMFPNMSLRLPWVKRLKPLIDAFIAPLADGKQFWVGFRLLARHFFFLLTLLDDQPRNITLCTFIILITIMEACIKPFKTTGRNIVDLFIMVNLTMVSFLAVVSKLSGESAYTVNVFVFILLTSFAGMTFAINIYYIVMALPCTKKLKLKSGKYCTNKASLWSSIQGKFNPPKSTTDVTPGPRSPNETEGMTHTSIVLPSIQLDVDSDKFVGYRESLLDLNS